MNDTPETAQPHPSHPSVRRDRASRIPHALSNRTRLPLLVIVASLSLSVSCGDSGPTEPDAGTVGPAGGAITVAAGRVTLTVPEGALDQTFRISVEPADEGTDDPRVVAGAVYRFEPAGLEFARPVELTIRYGADDLPVGVRARELRVVRRVGSDWQEIDGSGPAEGRAVVGSIRGFSVFGLRGVPVAAVSLSVDSASLAVGDVLQLDATPLADDGARLTARAVTWNSAAPEVATVDPDGLVTAVGPGSARITASSEDVSADARLAVVSVTARLAVSRQPGDAIAGVPLGVQPIVEARDALGNVVTGDDSTRVTASIASGGGTLEGTTSVRMNGGVAAFSDLILQGTVGDYTLSFTAPDLPPVTSDPFELLPGSADRLRIATQPADAASGEPFGTQPVVHVVDEAGNVAVGDDSTTITVEIGSGGGTLTGTTSVVVEDGVARFSDLAISGQVGERTLAFRAGGLAPVTSQPFELRAGATAVLRVRVQPADAVAGKRLGVQPLVETIDEAGNVTEDDTTRVKATLEPEGAELEGTDSVQVSRGAAQFRELGIAGPVGEYRLRFSAAGIAGTSSESFLLQPGPATHLSIRRQPAEAASGAPLGVQPVIEARDDFGNVATGDNSTRVTASIASGGGSLQGVTTVSVSEGVAAFTDLVIRGIVGDRTLEFSALGLTSDTSEVFMLEPGAASAATSVIGVSSEVVGIDDTETLTLQAQDAEGNDLTEGGLDVAFSVSGGTSEGEIGPTTDAGDGTYSATFTGRAEGTPLTVGATLEGAPVTSEPPTLRVVGGAIRGAVVLASGEPVEGGMVELRDEAGDPIASQVPDGDGRYAFGGLASGTYALHLEPAPGHSIGPGEPHPKIVELAGGDTAVVELPVQAALWFDDFTSYVDEADFHTRFANDPGGRRSGPQGSMFPPECNENRIHLDPTGGPDGKPAMRYDYWNRVEDPTGLDHNVDENGDPLQCAQEDPEASFSLFYARIFDAPGPEGDELWVRFVSKEGTNSTEDPDGPNWFSIGCGPNCNDLTNNYKFFRTFFSNESAQGIDGTFSIRMGASEADGTSLTNQLLEWTRFPDRPRLDMGDAPDWQGRWHTYVYGYEAVDGDWDNVTFQIWIDGELRLEITGVSREPPGRLEQLLIGANMNAGPSQEQCRWISEVGVYSTRPSVRPGG